MNRPLSLQIHMYYWVFFFSNSHLIVIHPCKRLNHLLADDVKNVNISEATHTFQWSGKLNLTSIFRAHDVIKILSLY